jgi:hypothetical protein
MTTRRREERLLWAYIYNTLLSSNMEHRNIKDILSALSFFVTVYNAQYNVLCTYICDTFMISLIFVYTLCR